MATYAFQSKHEIPKSKSSRRYTDAERKVLAFQILKGCTAYQKSVNEDARPLSRSEAFYLLLDIVINHDNFDPANVERAIQDTFSAVTTLYSWGMPVYVDDTADYPRPRDSIETINRLYGDVVGDELNLAEDRSIKTVLERQGLNTAVNRGIEHISKALKVYSRVKLISDYPISAAAFGPSIMHLGGKNPHELLDHVVSLGRTARLTEHYTPQEEQTVLNRIDTDIVRNTNVNALRLFATEVELAPKVGMEDNLRPEHLQDMSEKQNDGDYYLDPHEDPDDWDNLTQRIYNDIPRNYPEIRSTIRYAYDHLHLPGAKQLVRDAAKLTHMMNNRNFISADQVEAFLREKGNMSKSSDPQVHANLISYLNTSDRHIPIVDSLLKLTKDLNPSLKDYGNRTERKAENPANDMRRFIPARTAEATANRYGERYLPRPQRVRQPPARRAIDPDDIEMQAPPDDPDEEPEKLATRKGKPWERYPQDTIHAEEIQVSEGVWIPKFEIDPKGHETVLFIGPSKGGKSFKQKQIFVDGFTGIGQSKLPFDEIFIVTHKADWEIWTVLAAAQEHVYTLKTYGWMNKVNFYSPDNYESAIIDVRSPAHEGKEKLLILDDVFTKGGHQAINSFLTESQHFNTTTWVTIHDHLSEHALKARKAAQAFVFCNVPPINLKAIIPNMTQNVLNQLAVSQAQTNHACVIYDVAKNQFYDGQTFQLI